MVVIGLNISHKKYGVQLKLSFAECPGNMDMDKS
jgi:hypothetical protein